MKRRLLGILFGVVLVGAPSLGLACGMLVEEVASNPASFAAQTVLVHRKATTVDVHVRLTVKRGATDFSWILPAPPGATLSLGSTELFDALEAYTAPKVFITYDHSGGGCGDANKEGGGDLRGIDSVQVGQLGEYDYAIIGSGDTEAVVTWLTNNGYQVPEGAAAALQPYAEAGLDFIGIKLARPVEQVDQPTRPTPLVISSEDHTAGLPGYPLGLSAVSAGVVLPLVIYVIGPGRAQVEGVAQTTVVEVADRLMDTGQSQYPDAVDALAAEHTETLFVTEAVMERWGEHAPEALAVLHEEGAVLTRLYGRLLYDQVIDLQLGWSPEARTLVDPVQYRVVGDGDDGCRTAGGGQGTGLFFLLLIFGLIRRRRAR